MHADPGEGVACMRGIFERGRDVALARVTLLFDLVAVTELGVRRRQHVASEVVGDGVEHTPVVGEPDVEILVPGERQDCSRMLVDRGPCEGPRRWERRRLQGAVDAPKAGSGEDDGDHCGNGVNGRLEPTSAHRC